MMLLPDPRRIAAADMYGLHGSARRRRLIRFEFTAAPVLCGLLGVLSLITGGLWLVLGVWLIGIGANYVPLAIEAQRLSRGRALERHIAGVELGGEMSWGMRAQLWLLVPFALVAAAGLHGRRSSPVDVDHGRD